MTITSTVPTTSTPPTSTATQKPKLALTFDDGPSVYTPRILGQLQKCGGVATFCVLGNRIAQYSDTIRTAVAQGCEIISHTWDHKELTKLNELQIIQELVSVNQALTKIGMPETRLFRPPYGSQGVRTQRVATQLGMSIILWSVDTNDWQSKNADTICSIIQRNAKANSIILCHDIFKPTADAMDRAIPYLCARYELVTVSQLLLTAGAITAGAVYRNAIAV